jgi:hypothetical protein
VSNGVGQLQAVHGAGHVNVAKHYLNVAALLEQADSLIGIARFHDAKPRLLRNVDGKGTDKEIVFHDQKNVLRIQDITPAGGAEGNAVAPQDHSANEEISRALQIS